MFVSCVYLYIVGRGTSLQDTVTNSQMFYVSTSKYGIRKSILSRSGGCFLKNFQGASPTDLLIYNFLQ